MSQLAILGGEPVLKQVLPKYNSIGVNELNAVASVIRSGTLSGFYGSPGDQYLGGPVVKEFERMWSERFSIRHTISVNSATSGLFAAMGAVDLKPGDEVIVPPLTMSATVMAPIVYGGIPVFADIEPDTFCLDPECTEGLISPRTRAVIAVNLFGHPAQLEKLRSMADRHGIYLIEDNAQGPLAGEKGRYAGTIGHIGVFSLNYHKHIHTGEGGMCVTDDDDLAFRLRMIRNHGENVVGPMEVKNISGIIGFNYRLTEMSAAIGIEQLKEIDRHVEARTIVAERLSQGVRGLAGLTPPVVRSDCRHVYYVWGMKIDSDALGVSRRQFSRALEAEGFPHSTGYVRPLYMLPMFQKKIALGSYPFNLSTIDYKEGACPVAERMHSEELLVYEPCMYDISPEVSDLMAEAIRKVHRYRLELNSLE